MSTTQQRRGTDRPRRRSGAARRRARASERQERLYGFDVRWAYELGRAPTYAVAVSSCSCGWLSWLMPGAAREDREAFDLTAMDHGYLCDLGTWSDDREDTDPHGSTTRPAPETIEPWPGPPREESPDQGHDLATVTMGTTPRPSPVAYGASYRPEAAGRTSSSPSDRPTLEA